MLPGRFATLVIGLAACVTACSGSSGSNGTPGTGSSSPGPTASAGPSVPAPTVTSIAGVRAPLTSRQVSSVFGTSLPGPKAGTGSQPTFTYGDVMSSSHLVVSVTIYTPQRIAALGTTPAEFFTRGEDPGAEHVTGIGKQAYIVQDLITVLTQHNYVLQVAANQQVDGSQLKTAAQAAAQKL